MEIRGSETPPPPPVHPTVKWMPKLNFPRYAWNLLKPVLKNQFVKKKLNKCTLKHYFILACNAQPSSHPILKPTN